MLKRALLISKYRLLSKCSSHSLTTAKPVWDIVTAVCVERLPVISPKLTKMQETYNELLTQIEFEKSMKSDHEIRHEKDVKTVKKLSDESGNLDMDAAQLMTAQDFEDASTEELSKFRFASVETDADKNKDIQSLDRCLQNHLILLTEIKLGNKTHWLMPQGLRQEGESLRQTAERVFQSACGSDLKVQFFGNAPCGFYKYKYPIGVAAGEKVGAKVFFYYTRYLKGNLQENCSKGQWLTRNELETTLPEKYHTSVSKFLVDENQD